MLYTLNLSYYIIGRSKIQYPGVAQLVAGVAQLVARVVWVRVRTPLPGRCAEPGNPHEHWISAFFLLSHFPENCSNDHMFDHNGKYTKKFISGRSSMVGHDIWDVGVGCSNHLARTKIAWLFELPCYSLYVRMQSYGLSIVLSFFQCD